MKVSYLKLGLESKGDRLSVKVSYLKLGLESGEDR